MLSNSVGLIDSSYRGTLKVTLTKIANDAEDIKLPFKAVQMVLRKNVHYICEETEELDDTEEVRVVLDQRIRAQMDLAGSTGIN